MQLEEIIGSQLTNLYFDLCFDKIRLSFQNQKTESYVYFTGCVGGTFGEFREGLNVTNIYTKHLGVLFYDMVNSKGLDSDLYQECVVYFGSDLNHLDPFSMLRIAFLEIKVSEVIIAENEPFYPSYD